MSLHGDTENKSGTSESTANVNAFKLPYDNGPTLATDVAPIVPHSSESSADSEALHILQPISTDDHMDDKQAAPMSSVPPPVLPKTGSQDAFGPTSNYVPDTFENIRFFGLSVFSSNSDSSSDSDSSEDSSSIKGELRAVMIQALAKICSSFGPSTSFEASNSFEPGSSSQPCSSFQPSSSFEQSTFFSSNRSFQPSGSFGPSSTSQPSSLTQPCSSFVPSSSFRPRSSYESSSLSQPSSSFQPSSSGHSCSSFEPTSSFGPNSSPKSSSSFQPSRSYEPSSSLQPCTFFGLNSLSDPSSLLQPISSSQLSSSSQPSSSSHPRSSSQTSNSSQPLNLSQANSSLQRSSFGPSTLLELYSSFGPSCTLPPSTSLQQSSSSQTSSSFGPCNSLQPSSSSQPISSLQQRSSLQSRSSFKPITSLESSSSIEPCSLTQPSSPLQSSSKLPPSSTLQPSSSSQSNSSSPSSSSSGLNIHLEPVSFFEGRCFSPPRNPGATILEAISESSNLAAILPTPTNIPIPMEIDDDQIQSKRILKKAVSIQRPAREITELRAEGEPSRKIKKRRLPMEDTCSKKEHVNMVLIGHVDAGKSTIGGQIMSLTGMVDQRTLEKYEREAREKSRESWYLSWALDTNQEERERGKTVEVGRAYFETDKKHYTILDAPGHKSFVPNMIGGAAQADLAVLVISARKGEFETGFDRGGQTREHAMLAKTAGVKHLVALVNKMDDQTVNWDENRYNECREKILPYLKKLGFNPEKDLTFLPVSGQTGQGLLHQVTEDVCPWYRGPSFIEFINDLPPLDRKIDGPFVMPVVDKYKDMGTVLMGKVEAGMTRKGSMLLLMPNKVQVTVDQLWSDDTEVTSVSPGENVKVKLKGIEEEEATPGFVLCDIIEPITTGRVFDAQLVILELKSIICAGYSAVMHIHCASEEVSVKALLCLVDKKTGEKSKTRPRFVKQDQVAIMRIECAGIICLEPFKKFSQLGRFTLRDENKTIAIGKVLKVIE